MIDLYTLNIVKIALNGAIGTLNDIGPLKSETPFLDGKRDGLNCAYDIVNDMVDKALKLNELAIDKQEKETGDK